MLRKYQTPEYAGRDEHPLSAQSQYVLSPVSACGHGP